MSDDEGSRENLLDVTRLYGLASPFNQVLLEAVAADVRAGGATWELLRPLAPLPFEAAVPLRFLGALHRLALDGRAPELAAHYPSVGGDGDAASAAGHVLDVLARHEESFGPYLARPPQTNEVGRSAALVGGYCTVAGDAGLPLRVLEVGASAGLNLRFDHYCFEAGDRRFGDPSSPVRFVDWWLGGTPPLDAGVDIVERRGCDRDPVDPTTEDGRLRLLSYVWPDQLDRLTYLRAALSVAQRVPAPVDRADAAQWLAARLVEVRPGVVTMVVHSVFLQYPDAATRAALLDTIARAGRAATPEAPVAWLRLEPAADWLGTELLLTRWPGGDEQLLARGGFHLDPVTWL